MFDLFKKFFSKTHKMVYFPQFWLDMAGKRTSPYSFNSDKVCPSSIQFDNSIESYRVYDLQHTGRHFRKNHFFWLRGSQNVKIWWKFWRSVQKIRWIFEFRGLCTFDFRFFFSYVGTFIPNVCSQFQQYRICCLFVRGIKVRSVSCV